MGKHRKTAFQATIDDALTNAAWDAYDCDIMLIANEFNRHLANTPGFKVLNWQIIKAMVWTETGGPTDASWRSRPMQIGNPGDPGLKALFSGREGGELIIPPSLNGRLNATSATAMPLMNIRAGTAYLLMRFAKFGYVTVAEGPVSPYTVHAGDSFTKIAHAYGSTVQTLQQLNPHIRFLRPKHTILFQKAKLQKVVTGWNSVTTFTIARKYNRGDPEYARKLEYSLAVMRQVKRVVKCGS